MIGDLGEGILSLCVGESSISIGIFVDICGFPYLILVLFLILKYSGVCLLFPFFLTGVLRAVRAAAASLSVASRDTIGDSSLCSSFSVSMPSSSLFFLSSSSCGSSSSPSVYSLVFSSVSSSSSFSSPSSSSASSCSSVLASSSSISSLSSFVSSSSCFASSLLTEGLTS